MSVDWLLVEPSLSVIFLHDFSRLLLLRTRFPPDGTSEERRKRAKLLTSVWMFGFSALAVWVPAALVMKSPISFLIGPGASLFFQSDFWPSKSLVNGKSNERVPSKSCCSP